MSKMLRVDLSSGKLREEYVSDDDLRKYVGGRGLAGKVLFEELKPGIDPLGPDNKLVFAVGILEGSMAPGASRHGVFAKSPHTGLWGEAHAAGSFGIMMRKAGYIAVIFEGVSPTPVYVSVNDSQVKIDDASELWGKTIGDADDKIKEEIGDPKAIVAAIGLAGENLVPYASVISERTRAAGRAGMGAIMGSKKLKAVAVRGTGTLRVADPEKVKQRIMHYVKNWSSSGRDFGWLPGLTTNGTAGELEPLSMMGLCPTRNFREGTFEFAEEVTGSTMTETILVDRGTCPTCPIRCWRRVAVKDGPHAPVLPEYGGPEYETLNGFGPNCLVRDLKAIAEANMLCNMHGLDTISAGVSIGFAMECFERGIIGTKDTDGVDLAWGNAATMVQLVEDIAYKRGFGATLALGVRRMAEMFGHGSDKFAAHVKGLEIPAHEPRGKKGLGLSYVTCSRGADHNQFYHDPALERENFDPYLGITQKLDRYSTERTKVDYVIRSENQNAFLDSSIMCKHTNEGYTTPEALELIEAVTGWKITPNEMLKTGERIMNLTRSFNVREGMTRRDDRLPGRFSEPIAEGPTRGQTLDEKTVALMLDDYYEIRGWDNVTGIPTRSKLDELGLKFVADRLEALGKPFK